MTKTLIALAAVLAAGSALAQSVVYSTTQVTNTKETRYMGSPTLQHMQGTPFVPNPTVQAAFLSNHPCPSNPDATNATQCFGWQMVHVIAIACGGNDSVMNLMWLPDDMAARKRSYETRIDVRAPYAVPYTSCVRAIVN